MFKIFKHGKHEKEIPVFSRDVTPKHYPFDDLSYGDFIEVYVDHDKDWDQEVMFEYDLVFNRNHVATDSKIFKAQPLSAVRIIRIWRVS